MRQSTIDIKPWTLPVIVLALTIPIVVAFLTLGPFFGLLAGGAVGAALVLTAIRLGTQGPRRPGEDRDDAVARDPSAASRQV